MTEVVAKDQLVQFINRLERLEQEKTDLLEDIRDIFAEAKGTGFDVKALRQVLKLKKMDRNKLAEQEAMVELYRQALDI